MGFSRHVIGENQRLLAPDIAAISSLHAEIERTELRGFRMEAVRKRAKREMEEVEEEEVEQFFAIIRRLKDARAAANRIRPRPDPEEGEEGGRKKMMRWGKKNSSSWVPKFEVEDFDTGVESTGSLDGSKDSGPDGQRRSRS